MANIPSPFLAAVHEAIVNKDGKMTRAGFKLFQDWDTRLTNYISTFGVVQSAGMVPASPAAQGAVVMPVGATTNILGSSSTHSSGDFDPTGAAAAAQTAAELFASDATNITTGTLANAVIPTPTLIALGGVKAVAPIANDFVTAIDITGTPILAQPAFTNISGIAAPAQLPVATNAALGVVRPDGTSITIAAGVITSVGGGAVPGFADAEVPSGLINGSNVTYTLAHSPSPAASLILSLAGQIQLQDAAGDYTLAAGTITFATAPALGPLLAWYRY